MDDSSIPTDELTDLDNESEGREQADSANKEDSKGKPANPDIMKL